MELSTAQSKSLMRKKTLEVNSVGARSPCRTACVIRALLSHLEIRAFKYVYPTECLYEMKSTHILTSKTALSEES